MLLDLHQRFYSLNRETFANNSTFTAAVDKAFRTIVNDTTINRPANGPEILARYCDMMLKRGAGKKENVASSATGAGVKSSRRRATVGAEDSDPTETLVRMVLSDSASLFNSVASQTNQYDVDHVVQVHR